MNPDPRARDLIAAGKVRAGLFLPQFSRDPATGEIKGHGTGYVGIELTRRIARDLGVSAEIIGYPTPSAVVDAVTGSEIDMAFLGIEPTRAALLDFTPPMFRFDYTYLVPEGSRVHRIADVDTQGRRIAIVGNHASALALRPLVTKASLVSLELPDEAFEALRAGEADVFACPRDVLLHYAAQAPGSRVLDDAFGFNRVGIAVRKGRADLLAYLSDVVTEAKSGGVMGQVIETGQLIGFSVAD